MTAATLATGTVLEYEVFGTATAEPMLLIQGLGAQLVGWRREWCQALADRGFRVIRFDNRDVGLSSRFPDVEYRLADLAGDCVGLLDVLGIDRAHVVGQSMGGMVAQELACDNPERVASLCLLYSAPSTRHLLAQPDLSALLDNPRPRTRDAAGTAYLASQQGCLSAGYPADLAWLYELGALSYDRGYDPHGVLRQWQAIAAAPDRTERLAGVRVRTLVVHGDSDRKIATSGGRALADAIPGATLKIVPGMGHELPPALWPELVAAIVDNARAGRD